ncbi:hypothetical protein ACERK3_03035 [Phycisphaerales bacterium AB-hyl4]|uniref:Uncharacterized protein n=1 Tax=Natronomicrosphaera hydrolytica TaxID=3242702 RepID=A0ABV4U464_9BACT
MDVRKGEFQFARKSVKTASWRDPSIYMIKLTLAHFTDETRRDRPEAIRETRVGWFYDSHQRGQQIMRKIQNTQDYSGRTLSRGETVSTLNGYLTARICDIAADDGATFVRLRPLHQPYGPGTWHAADRVVWVAAASRRRRRRKSRAAAEASTAEPVASGSVAE